MKTPLIINTFYVPHIQNPTRSCIAYTITTSPSLSSTAPGYSCRPLMKSGTKAFSGSSSFLDLISGMNYLLLASKESKAHPSSLPTLNLWGTSRKSTSSSSLHIISSRRTLTLINSVTLSLYWYGLSHWNYGYGYGLAAK